MLKRHVELQQYAVRATDARIGHIGTFMVERGQWTIRYLTVNTGDWLDQRPVLLNRAAFERIDHNAKQLILNLSRDDVEKSPEVNPEEPISRENQQQLHDYYSWPAYWGRDEEDIIDTSQMAFEESADPADAQGDVLEDAEPTDLQSVSDLETFFHVDTTDEDIGRTLKASGHWCGLCYCSLRVRANAGRHTGQPARLGPAAAPGRSARFPAAPH